MDGASPSDDSRARKPSRRALLIAVPALAVAGCDRAESIVPDIERPPLAGLTGPGGWEMPGFAKGHFRNRVTLLNVWASWCPYCRGEHELLKTLEQRVGLPLSGLVHLDAPEPAVKYLREAGNPYRSVAHDKGDVMGRAIRQRGVPATYVIGHDGLIVARVPGALSVDAIERVLRPSIRAAQERLAAARVG
jgi:cytochrome c biogenesis protein CcmG/thiol:disulfide interchange protein DsbE